MSKVLTLFCQQILDKSSQIVEYQDTDNLL
jgi:hypothetical protein